MTNFEKIKNMSVDEMTDKLDDLTVCGYCPVEKFCGKNGDSYYTRCKSVWKKWLESEVKMTNDWSGNTRAIYTTLGASNHTEKECPL